MSKLDLIKKSQNLCVEAYEILEKTNAIEILSKLGKVDIVGSLKLKLMYRRDIDLFVVSDVINTDMAKKITQFFLEANIFKKVTLIDYYKVQIDDMPRGFYWELIIFYAGYDWKIDVWYLKPEEIYTRMVFDALKKFELALLKNHSKAEIILEIKEAYFDGVKYKDNVTGFDIYTAVFDRGINSLEEFAASR
mgnify:CR=1 FL=1